MEIVSFYKKSRDNYCLLHLPPPLYQRYPLSIKAAKAADLRKLTTEYLPNTAKGMHIDLPAVEDETDSDWCITLFCLLWYVKTFEPVISHT